MAEKPHEICSGHDRRLMLIDHFSNGLECVYGVNTPRWDAVWLGSRVEQEATERTETEGFLHKQTKATKARKLTSDGC